MTPIRMAGIVLLVIGVVLLAMGYNATQATTEQFAEAVTGQYSDRTVWYLVGGIAAFTAGLLMAVFGRKKS